MLNLYTAHDALKDGALTTLGMSPAAVLPHVEPAIWLGILSILITTILRLLEIWLRYRKGKPQ